MVATTCVGRNPTDARELTLTAARHAAVSAFRVCGCGGAQPRYSALLPSLPAAPARAEGCIGRYFELPRPSRWPPRLFVVANAFAPRPTPLGSPSMIDGKSSSGDGGVDMQGARKPRQNDGLENRLCRALLLLSAAARHTDLSPPAAGADFFCNMLGLFATREVGGSLIEPRRQGRSAAPSFIGRPR